MKTLMHKLKYSHKAQEKVDVKDVMMLLKQNKDVNGAHSLQQLHWTEG